MLELRSRKSRLQLLVARRTAGGKRCRLPAWRSCLGMSAIPCNYNPTKIITDTRNLARSIKLCPRLTLASHNPGHPRSSLNKEISEHTAIHTHAYIALPVSLSLSLSHSPCAFGPAERQNGLGKMSGKKRKPPQATQQPSISTCWGEGGSGFTRCGGRGAGEGGRDVRRHEGEKCGRGGGESRGGREDGSGTQKQILPIVSGTKTQL